MQVKLWPLTVLWNDAVCSYRCLELSLPLNRVCTGQSSDSERARDQWQCAAVTPQGVFILVDNILSNLAVFTVRQIVHWPIYTLDLRVNSNRDTVTEPTIATPPDSRSGGWLIILYDGYRIRTKKNTRTHHTTLLYYCRVWKPVLPLIN